MGAAHRSVPAESANVASVERSAAMTKARRGLLALMTAVPASRTPVLALVETALTDTAASLDDARVVLDAAT
jgi:hypothetical protein